MRTNIKDLFKIPEIDTKKSRQQRASGLNWSKAQKANKKQYLKPASKKIDEGTFKKVS